MNQQIINQPNLYIDTNASNRFNRKEVMEDCRLVFLKFTKWQHCDPVLHGGRRLRMKLKLCVIVLLLFAGSVMAAQSAAENFIVGLITKTEDNPFFVKMKEGALLKAAEAGLELRTYSGTHQGDTETQIDAIDSLIAAGARGILITPSDPAVLAEAVTRARNAGVLVIALDTPFDPVDLADGTFATDNFRAGELIGKWARAKLADKARDVKIATLDISDAQVTVEVLRNQGFLRGFGVDINDPKQMYDEDDPRIVGSHASFGSAEGGREAMAVLLNQYPDIDLVYTINEPAAFGAYQTISALGMADTIVLVSVDGSCEGIRNVARGAIGATAMQYPLRMAALGIDAVVAYVESGTLPAVSDGLDFFDTGTTLVTNESLTGVESIGAQEGLSECWG